MSYFCPKCKTLFEVPESWVSPCCFADNIGGDNYTCTECGKEFQDWEEIPQCPKCSNVGEDGFIAPDLEIVNNIHEVSND